MVYIYKYWSRPKVIYYRLYLLHRQEGLLTSLGRSLVLLKTTHPPAVTILLSNISKFWLGIFPALLDFFSALLREGLNRKKRKSEKLHTYGAHIFWSFSHFFLILYIAQICQEIMLMVEGRDVDYIKNKSETHYRGEWLILYGLP